MSCKELFDKVSTCTVKKKVETHTFRVRSHERRNEFKPVRDLISAENLTCTVQSALYLCSHELRRNETQNGMDFISVILIEMKFQTGMRFSCEHNLLEMK